MTRVSTAGQTQLLLNTLLRNQELQRQSRIEVATLKKSTDFKGLARDAVTLLGARAMEARTEAFIHTNAVVARRLETYNVSLVRLADIAQTLRQDLMGAIEHKSPAAFMEKVNAGFAEAAGFLNTKVDGRYIFAGTRTDVPPVNATTSAALLALSQTADAFDNNDIKARARISENTVKDYGILAEDIATPLFEAFRRIMQFNAGTLPSGAGAFAPAGAFQDPLSDNQRDFLINELAGIQTAFDKLNQEVAKNGVGVELLDDTQERHKDDLNFTRLLIAEIESVDPAEAITRLNERQQLFEASLHVMARLGRLSLLNFL